MSDRITYKLKQSESKIASNQDSLVPLSFVTEQRLLPVGEINHVVNVEEQFNKERNSTFIYRIKGTVTPIFSNPLMNPDGNSLVGSNGNGLDIFYEDVFKKDPVSTLSFGKEDLNYKESYNKHLTEKDGWFGYYEPDTTKLGVREYYDIEPTRKRFDLNSYINKNWELTITYPYDKDDKHYVVYDGTENGLLINGAKSVIVGGKPMVAIACAVRHGLSIGDTVKLFNVSDNLYNKTFVVKRIGLDDGTYKDNYFVIDLDPTTVQIDNSFGTGRMRRLVNGQESIYYLRKFKKLINNGDYEMYPLAFSKNIYNDQNYQFVINQDIDIEGLTDNLGRPLSELYVTFIKTDSDNMFGPLKSGLDLEDLPGNIGGIDINDQKINLSNVRQIHDGSTYNSDFISHKPLENDLYNKYDNTEWFYGDLVEYNKYSVIETKLTDVLHRFNTVNREKGTNPDNKAKGPRREGYIYKPHYLYKIREFSSYVEQGDISIDGIPDYAENLGDGRYLWRYFLDIGIYDGVGDLLDYPFTNGAHYLHQNICLMAIRQDPFGKYNLYYEGNTLTSNNGFGATAIANVISGVLTSINVTNGGYDYKTAPEIKITGGGGVGATATATVSGGKITTITVTSGGSGYVSTPTVTIVSFDPADPIGDAYTDKFQVKSSQNVC